MSGLMPDGEDLRRAVKWMSECRVADPGRPLSQCVEEATFKFDLSPRDADFLIRCFSERGGE